ncbi:hypothetical protein ACH3XW_34790 [Acanthocheilonema viteae]
MVIFRQFPSKLFFCFKIILVRRFNFDKDEKEEMFGKFVLINQNIYSVLILSGQRDCLFASHFEMAV